MQNTSVSLTRELTLKENDDDKKIRQLPVTLYTWAKLCYRYCL